LVAQRPGSVIIGLGLFIWSIAMADVVTATLLENGPRNWAYRFTSVSDGTGESGVVKVDGSSAGPLGVNDRGVIVYPTVHIKIREVIYDIKGMLLRILWDATAPVDALDLGGFGTQKFHTLGGIFIPVGTAGATGRILFTTAGQIANSAYTVIMRGTKGVPQN
jgi:hypothetical protein